MTVITGTTLGLHASPGDGGTSPPSVTFAYKRAEMALVPTSGSAAQNNQDPATNQDAYSTMCVFGADLNWFGTAWIGQFIATGHAARNAATNPSFAQALTGSPDATSNSGAAPSENGR